ncbi:MAG: 2-methylcitrate dehydratase family protein, partial [Hyphomicrobiales bacterium]|nr:2-methylcitrate dehydratase family protein [Hyphomicrobiales bacterium]
WLLAGLAARAGVTAALAARDGYAGDAAALDGDWLRRTHGLEFDGAIFRSDEPILHETSFKPWCAAKQTTSAIDAFRQLLAEGLDPARIASLRVETPNAYRAMISHQPPGRLGRIVNIAWQFGVAAYRPDALLDLEREDFGALAPFAALVKKVEVAADPTLDSFYPARWPAKVIATRDDGSIAERLVTDALGDPEMTLDAADVARKFKRVTQALMSEAQQRALLDGVLRPERLDPAALYAMVREATA